MTDSPDIGQEMLPDKEYFQKLATTRMPFGRYTDRLLIDLPEPYVVWMAQKGFPKGELGLMLQTVYEIKVNGLEYLFKPFRRKKSSQASPSNRSERGGSKPS